METVVTVVVVGDSVGGDGGSSLVDGGCGGDEAVLLLLCSKVPRSMVVFLRLSYEGLAACLCGKIKSSFPDHPPCESRKKIKVFFLATSFLPCPAALVRDDPPCHAYVTPRGLGQGHSKPWPRGLGQGHLEVGPLLLVLARRPAEG